jgi:predicted TIM-barrel fold metal-dependent hydrolase
MVDDFRQMGRSHSRVDRRTFLAQAGLAALAFGAANEGLIAAQVAVPNSVGTEPPTLRVPAGACDCHHHIYDLRFPPTPNALGNPFQINARVDEYRLLQRRLGLTRNIVVTPAPYIRNNGVTVDALEKFGPNARGVVLVGPEVADDELRTLHAVGVRGVRFGANYPADMIEPLAKRISQLGWHAQIFLTGDRIVAAADVLGRLPLPLVFDHMGALLPAGVSHPGFAVIRRLVDRGRTWVKLSGPYITTARGSDGQAVVTHTDDYSGATLVAQAFVRAAPERLVWGSDWPHPGLSSDAKPNDAVLLDLLEQWAPSEATRRRILVENPETLYGFHV